MADPTIVTILGVDFTSGALLQVGTLVGGGIMWWLKTDRLHFKQTLTIAQMQKDIIENHANVTKEVSTITSKLESQDAALRAIQIQLAALTGQKSTIDALERLPDMIAKRLNVTKEAA